MFKLPSQQRFWYHSSTTLLTQKTQAGRSFTRAGPILFRIIRDRYPFQEGGLIRVILRVLGERKTVFYGLVFNLFAFTALGLVESGTVAMILTPLTALLLAKAVADADLPPGVFNLLIGAGSTVGAEMCTNPMVDKVALTGSTETGRAVMKMAADTVKKVTLELGGKSPSIVLDDADLEIAVVPKALNIVG